MRIRMFAAAAEAAGTEELEVEGPATLAELRAELAARFGSEFDRVWQRCSFLIDGVAAGGADSPESGGTDSPESGGAYPLPRGAVVDVLPPFAGG